MSISTTSKRQRTAAALTLGLWLFQPFGVLADDAAQPAPATDIQIEYTNQGDAPIAGEKVTYTAVIRNNGTLAARNVEALSVRLNREFGFTYVAEDSDPRCHQEVRNGYNGGYIVACLLGEMAPQAEETLELTWIVPADFQCDEVFTHHMDVHISNGANDWSSLTETVLCPTADLITFKDPVPANRKTIHKGQEIEYTLKVMNQGPFTAKNAVIRDTIPSQLTFNAAKSDPACSSDGTTVSCGPVTLATGEFKMYGVTFNQKDTVQCGDVISNQITAVSDTVDPNSQNTASKHVQLKVDCSADLQITKTGPPLFVEGQPINYCSADFNGDFKVDAADYTVWRDNLGATNATKSTGDANGDKTVNGADYLEWQRQFGKPCQVDILYGLTIKNNGPTPAEDITVVDTVPNGLTYRADLSDKRCSLVGNTVMCEQATLAATGSTTIYLAFDAPANPVCGSEIWNTAAVSSHTPDSNHTNNTSNRVITKIGCDEADLVANKKGPGVVKPDDTITYNLIVENDGPAVAKNVVITDKIPANLTFVSDNRNACTVSGSTLICTTAELAVDKSFDVAATFKFTAAPQCDAVLENSIVVSSDTKDPDLSNNTSDTIKTTVRCPKADVKIEKTGTTTTKVGTTAEYTLKVTNNGPDTASGLLITDTFPAGLSFVSASRDGQPIDCLLALPAAAQPTIGGQVACEVAQLLNGKTTAITLKFKVSTSTELCDATLTNKASVSTKTIDPVTTNNTSEAKTTLTCDPAPMADVKVEKTGPATVKAGNTIAYTVTVRNLGPSAATGVTMTDTFPAGLSFLAAQSSTGCQLALPGGTQPTIGGALSCSVGTLAANAEKVYTFVFQTPAGENWCDANLTNKATVSSGTTDPVHGNNSSDVTTKLTCDPVVGKSADLQIIKTGSTSLPKGGTGTYTITIKNLGPDTATGVTMSDTFPAELTFLSAQSSTGCQLALPGGTQTTVGGNLSCSVGTLAANESRSYTFAFQVRNNDDVCGDTITNIASVNAATNDPNVVNNQSSAQTTLTCVSGGEPDLRISKTDNTEKTVPNATLTYVITVTNSGSAVANNVTVTDILPDEVQFLISPDGGIHTDGVVTWSNQTFGIGQSKQFTVRVRVRSDVANNTTLLNTAYVSNKSATDTTIVEVVTEEEGDITVEITDDPTSLIIPCEDNRIEYTITLTNHGTKNKYTDVVAELDDLVDFDYASDGGDYDDDDHEVTWDNVLVLGGSTETLRLEVEVDEHQIHSDERVRLEVSTDDDSDSEETKVTYKSDCGSTYHPPYQPPVTAVGEIVVDKIADRREAQPGSVVQYTIVVRNNGGAIVQNLLVQDQFTAGALTIEDAAGGTAVGNGLSWTIPQIGPGESITLRYRARIGAHMSHGQRVENTVRVSSPALDRPATDSVTIAVIEYLPQTGIASLASSLTGGQSNIRLSASHSSSAGGSAPSIPLVVWITISAMGLAAGTITGRRLFL